MTVAPLLGCAARNNGDISMTAIWRCVGALAICLAGCDSGPSVQHGNTSAGACSVCRTDGGAYFDECSIVGKYVYFCVGGDAGASCATGRCALSCDTTLDCRVGGSCDTVHTLHGDIKICN